MSLHLDFQAIGRVVDRVREADQSLGSAYLIPPFEAGPEEWKRVRDARAAMSHAISTAYIFRDIHPDLTSVSRTKRKYKALLRVRRLARDLADLIEGEELPLSSSLAGRFPAADEDGFQVLSFTQLMFGLQSLQQAAASERDRLKAAGLHEAAAVTRFDDVSLATPGAMFMSRMGKAFEKAFAQTPSIRFPSEWDPGGPFIMFVEAATAEAGDPMSRDTIRKAWDRSRATGQTQRKD